MKCTIQDSGFFPELHRIDEFIITYLNKRCNFFSINYLSLISSSGSSVACCQNDSLVTVE